MLKLLCFQYCDLLETYYSFDEIISRKLKAFKIRFGFMVNYIIAGTSITAKVSNFLGPTIN